MDLIDSIKVTGKVNQKFQVRWCTLHFYLHNGAGYIFDDGHASFSSKLFGSRGEMVHSSFGYLIIIKRYFDI